MIAPVYHPADLEEEEKAANALKTLLTGKMIDPTKAPDNTDHQFKPSAVEFKVTLPARGVKHDGAILEIAFHQIDRHHPELVREMLLKEFKQIPPLAEFSLTKDDITHDPINSITTVHIAVPKGKADDIIHALSVLVPQPQQTSWVARSTSPLLQESLSFASEAEEGWTSKISRFLGFKHR